MKTNKRNGTWGEPVANRAVLAALFAALLAMGVAWPSYAELYYEAVSSVSPERGKDRTDWKVRGWVAGDKARVEFTDGANPLFKPGTYLVTTDGGANLFLVNPKDSTYSRLALDELFAAVGAAMQSLGGAVKMEFSDASSEKLLEEAGGTLVGHPTRHLQFKSGYKMKIKVIGLSQEQSIVSMQDFWVAQDIKDPGMFIWLRSNPPKTGDHDFDEFLAGEISKVSGVMLKSRTVSHSTNKKGKTSSSTVETEVTLLEKRDAPAGGYGVPSGFREAPLFLGLPQQ